jgi:LacI family transcriptional regulator
MYTMRDVARLAGVSVATVSAVINGTAKVSPRLTRKVQQAMQGLDYHPDQVARSLKMGKTHVVGMIIPDVTNMFFPEVMLGVEDAAREAQYSVILCNSNEDPEQEQRHLNTLFARRVDGVLLASPDPASASARLSRRNFPLVYIDRVPPGCGFYAVSTDNVEAAYAAVRHLIVLGHERIAMVCGPLHLSPFIDRLEGFRRAMQEAHLPVREEYLRQGGLQIEGGYRSALELLRLPEPPTAIFSSNNKIGLGILRAIFELGVPCPGRISVVGFDDFAGAEYFNPPLTAVAQPMYELGQSAMHLLLEQMQETPGQGAVRENKVVLLRAELRVRGSTAAPGTESTSDIGLSGTRPTAITPPTR